MVSNLETLDAKLAMFRQIWNERVNAIDMAELIYQRKVAAIMDSDNTFDEPGDTTKPENAPPPEDETDDDEDAEDDTEPEVPDHDE